MTHCVLRRVILSVCCYLNEERFVRKGNEAKEINLFRIIRSQNLTVPAHAAFYGFNLDCRKSLETGCDHLLNYQRWFYKVLLASNSAQTIILK